MSEARARIAAVWQLSPEQAAALSTPEAVADLTAATDCLTRHLRPERVPDVVRRPAVALGGASLLDLATAGRHAEVRRAVTDMFELPR